MPTNLKEIAKFLSNQGLCHDVRPEYSDIITIFDTENYKNEEGEKKLPIVILVEEKGRFIKIFSPRCYRYSNSRYKEAFFKTLLAISFHTKMVQFECDQYEEGIYAMVEFPIEDSKLSEKQLIRSLFSIVRVLERYDSVIREALDSGIIAFQKTEEDESLSNFVSLMSKIEEPKKTEESPQIEEDSCEWI
jgi:hypothetical protein